MPAASPSPDAGGVPLDAPPLTGPVMFDQHWRDLAFLHWPVDPAQVAGFLPPGTRPDIWQDGTGGDGTAPDGATYVGLVPFRMYRAGPGPHLPVPYFGSFLEWNVRLYSVDTAGRHGVVFRSLDATRLAVVLGARAAGLPYRWAGIGAARTGDEVRWTLRRRGWRRPTSRLTLRLGEPVTATPLELFLVSRWGLHTRAGRRTAWVPTHHERWTFRAAEVSELADELVAAASLDPIGPPLRALWTPGVHARFGLPQLVEAGGGQASSWARRSS